MVHLAWQIKRWGALPEAGGLRDQPAGLLTRAGYLLDIYDAHHAYYNALLAYDLDGLGEWEARNESIMKILADVRELKKRYGE